VRKGRNKALTTQMVVVRALFFPLCCEQEELYMVVQPTVASCTLVMEAKTIGEPPLREPYSRV
jgi:hypothetical protein